MVTFASNITTTITTTLVVVVVLMAIRRGLLTAVPVWKATRRAFIGIHTEGNEDDPVFIHHACPRQELELMHRSTLYLYKTFGAMRMNKEVEGLTHIGAFPSVHPICVAARHNDTGELYIMLRGRRFVEENELFHTWRQAKINIAGRTFQVFQGFVQVFRQIELQVKGLLLSHKGRVHIVGHSLGAGVGVLVAISLHLAFPGRIGSVVLLANTRVAAPTLAQFIEKDHPQLWNRIWRVVNECDPFVQLPLSYMPDFDDLGDSGYNAVAYTHVGQCVLLFQSMCANVHGGHQLKVYNLAIEQAIACDKQHLSIKPGH